ncbi:hypothetical protein BT63DRAFT_443282 [Microthyrium microscopicum]|uniref:Uncharacterized protein n=1 Tax=Microthyrium microscopicum TaxID=703497 RepID=A0A6A6TY04_9PEZI|nr:hypothetical protein BT63DRAFT_443282 [Microthyrium microscopicum]
MAISLKLLGSLVLLAHQSNAEFSWDFNNKAQFAETPASAANPNITKLEPQFFKDLKSQRVRVKYGPHSVPSSKVIGGMATFLDRNAAKPCDDCLITYMHAGLEYPNGTVANSDTGMWLHHSVAINVGRKDTVCQASELAPQRFFASGNERTPVDLSVGGTSKTGYYLKAKDKMFMLMELMNEIPEMRDAVMTVDYEFIPGMPKGFQALDTIWLDIGGCMNSDVPPTSNTTSDYTMQPAFKMPMDGMILGMGSHLHDGGTHLTVTKNDKEICNSVATYGAAPGYIDSNMMPGMNMTGMQGMEGMKGMPGMDKPMAMMHVSNISSCYKPDNAEFKTGDEFQIKAFYDMTKHMGMYEADGKMSPIMGISIMYVVPQMKKMTGGENGGENGKGGGMKGGMNGTMTGGTGVSGGKNSTMPEMSLGMKNSVGIAGLAAAVFVALLI